jgi:hypothetical protein
MQKAKLPLPLILEPLLLFWANPPPPPPPPATHTPNPPAWPHGKKKKTYIVPYTFEYSSALNFELIVYLFIYITLHFWI